MLSPIVNEFIEALDQEIDALKKGKGGSVVKVFNGRFIRQTAGLFVYIFNLENFLAALEDSPANIEIQGVPYPAYILSTLGLEVEIGIEHDCGSFVPEAKLETNLWYLLDILKRKFLDCESVGTKIDFGLSETLFSGHTLEQEVTEKIQIHYSLFPHQPNEAQQRAIESSACNQVSIIWGPPGTGKTATIAKAIEAHLNLGRRILLVSHANNAVDEALEDVAEQLKTTSFYQEGKLVRLGKPQEEHLQKLEKDYELVLPNKIAAKLGTPLIDEKTLLHGELMEIENTIGKMSDIIQILQISGNLSTELDGLKKEIYNSETQLRATKNGIIQMEESTRKNIGRLREAQAISAIERFFRRLNPQKIQGDIDKTGININTKTRMADEIASRLKQLSDLSAMKENTLKAHDAKVTEILTSSHISREDLERKQSELVKRKNNILARIAEINRQLEEIEKNILSGAKLVATTLTKTFSSKQFPDIPFDVLILDEASMAPLPHIYWALGHCRKNVTVVGDFLQLPPICISDKPMAQKWLGRSIYEVLDINSIAKAETDVHVKLLDTQYRMVPDISYIPNHFFYDDKLRDSLVEKTGITNNVSKSALVLVETAAMNPWCSRISSGGRFNLNHALVTTNIAKRIIQSAPDCRIGILTPYVAQARLINKIAKEWQLSKNLRVSTVHKFQGGEEQTIIFDSVEGAGNKVAPMLDDSKPDSDAKLVLNVAFTRAQKQLYLVAHTKHLLNDLNPGSALARIIHHFQQKAEILRGEDFVDNYYAADYEKWADSLFPTPSVTQEPISGKLFTERNFWAQFFQDIKTVNKRLIILSPFVSIRRSGMLMDYFQAMRGRSTEIRIYTRPLNQQVGELASQGEVVIAKFREMGISVIERSNMHQKVAIIDDSIAWEGSLNILSHRDTGEQMRRFEGSSAIGGSSAIEDIIRNLELDTENAAGNISDQKCPKCGSPMVFRKSRYGRFLGCSRYPHCNEKISLGKNVGWVKPK